MTLKKRVRDMSPIEQIQHYEDRQFFKAIDKAAGIGDPMEISIQPCVFGYALIATTWKDRVMAVELGESLDDLMRTFINRWNKSNSSSYLFVGDDKPDPQVVQQVLRAVNEGIVDYSIIHKMSFVGTAFQRKVWQSLLNIKPGTVETYQQVADHIGDPKAVRAVGNAVGANPIAVIIPCHRVVRSDGKMGGYRWGEGTKRKLLEREKLI